MRKQFCPYCGLPLTEKCGCERIAAEEHDRVLVRYYNDPLVHAGWTQQDMIDLRRREQ